MSLNMRYFFNTPHIPASPHCLGVLSSSTSMNSLSILCSAEKSCSAYTICQCDINNHLRHDPTFCPPINRMSFSLSLAGAILMQLVTGLRESFGPRDLKNDGKVLSPEFTCAPVDEQGNSLLSGEHKGVGHDSELNNRKNICAIKCVPIMLTSMW